MCIFIQHGQSCASIKMQWLPRQQTQDSQEDGDLDPRSMADLRGALVYALCPPAGAGHVYAVQPPTVPHLPLLRLTDFSPT